MRFLKKCLFVLPALIFLAAPSPAQAQVIIRGFGNSGFNNFGSFSPFGLPYYGTGGLYGPWGSPWGWGGGLGGRFAVTPGFPAQFGGISPYGNVAGISSNYYGPAWTYSSPYDSLSYGYAGNMAMPGFGAGEMPRVRAAAYPAIAEPSRDVIAAALGSDVKAAGGKARLSIHVPCGCAKVYLDGVLTSQTGLDRMYVTPNLAAGGRYSLDVHVTWPDEGGTDRSFRRQVAVRPGEVSMIDLRGAN
jgi:uncharacterized protein (TIGR03000 family)